MVLLTEGHLYAAPKKREAKSVEMNNLDAKSKEFKRMDCPVDNRSDVSQYVLQRIGETETKKTL